VHARAALHARRLLPDRVMADHEALALIELDSIASGLRALDALVKKAPVSVLEANLVEPGKFLVLFAGPVGELGEAFEAANAEVPTAVGAKMFLARVE